MDRDLCRKLAPNARILVWLITESDQLIADSLDFTVDGAFANQVCFNHYLYFKKDYQSFFEYITEQIIVVMHLLTKPS